MGNLKCVHCTEEYIKLPADDPAKVDGSAWLAVNDADTMVPSWQQTMLGPGQLVLACIALPICINHIAFKEQTPQEKAARSGLALPGMN